MVAGIRFPAIPVQSRMKIQKRVVLITYVSRVHPIYTRFPVYFLYYIIGDIPLSYICLIRKISGFPGTGWYINICSGFISGRLPGIVYFLRGIVK